MLKILLNSKRKPKPSGKKKKPIEMNVEVIEDEEVVEEPQAYVEEPGPAKSQANPFAKKQGKKTSPEFNTSFASSNIDGVAYDPTKKQLWVRFKGKDVYTYFDVPLKIYRGFWSAPSKGHYFWEKIRKNPHIKYQKISASLYFVPVRGYFRLNANRQANVASIAKAFKNLAKKHPEWEVEPELQNVFNGKQVKLKPLTVDIVGYGDKVRVNLIDNYDGSVKFTVTNAVETPIVAAFIEKQVLKYLSKKSTNACRLQLKAATSNNINIQSQKTACEQLLGFVKEATPELDWDDLILINGGYRLRSSICTVDIHITDEEAQVTILDLTNGDVIRRRLALPDFIANTLTEILYVTLQGD